MENLGHRRTGSTYRMLLQALVRASGLSNQRVWIVYSAYPALNYGMNTLFLLTRPLNDFVKSYRATHRMEFANGSEIRSFTLDQIGRAIPGSRIDAFYLDNSTLGFDSRDNLERELGLILRPLDSHSKG